MCLRQDLVCTCVHQLLSTLHTVLSLKTMCLFSQLAANLSGEWADVLGGEDLVGICSGGMYIHTAEVTEVMGGGNDHQMTREYTAAVLEKD